MLKLFLKFKKLTFTAEMYDIFLSSRNGFWTITHDCSSARNRVRLDSLQLARCHTTLQAEKSYHGTHLDAGRKTQRVTRTCHPRKCLEMSPAALHNLRSRNGFWCDFNNKSQNWDSSTCVLQSLSRDFSLIFKNSWYWGRTCVFLIRGEPYTLIVGRSPLVQ